MSGFCYGTVIEEPNPKDSVDDAPAVVEASEPAESEGVKK